MSATVTDLADERHARANGGWYVTKCTCLACEKWDVTVTPGPARERSECPGCGRWTLAPRVDPQVSANTNEAPR